MARDEIINGTNLLLKIAGKPLAHAKSHQLSLNVETRDTSNKDSGGWKSIAAGRLSWSISAEALTNYGVDGTVKQGYQGLFALATTREPVTVVSEGELIYTGQAIITSVEQDAPDEENSTLSVQLEGTGPLTETEAN